MVFTWLRSPVNLSRLRYHRESKLIVYEPKAGRDADDAELMDPLEFPARVLMHPDLNKHLVRLYVARAFMLSTNRKDLIPKIIDCSCST
jgi:hypothetical protein